VSLEAISELMEAAPARVGEISKHHKLNINSSAILDLKMILFMLPPE
jgi:hypothetical protein